MKCGSEAAQPNIACGKRQRRALYQPGAKPQENLAWLTLLGSLMIGSTFLLPGFYTRHHLVFTTCVAFTLFAFGFTLMLKALRALRNGVQNEQWPPERIAPLRAIFTSPFTAAFMIALFVSWGILALACSHGLAHSIGWSLYMPALAISQISSIFRRPSEKTRQEPFWHNLSPLHSNHWGER